MSSPSGQLIGGLLPFLVPIHLLAATQIPAADSSELAADAIDSPDMVVGETIGPERDAWPIPEADDGDDVSDDALARPASAAMDASGATDEAAAESSVTPAASEAPPPMMSALAKARREGFSWDLQVEIGGPVWANTWGDLFEPWLNDLWEVIKFNNPDFTAFARVRVGFLALKEPWYFGAGITGGYGGVGGASIGLQADLTNTWGGVWIQAGTEWNEDHGLVLSAGGGYQVIGGEWRVYDGGRNIALLAKIRLPFGLAAFVKGIYDKR